MLRRLCVALTLGILMMAALAQGAAADPSNPTTVSRSRRPATGRRSSSPSAATATSRLARTLVGSTAVFVLQAFDITFQFTLPGEPTQL